MPYSDGMGIASSRIETIGQDLSEHLPRILEENSNGNVLVILHPSIATVVSINSALDRLGANWLTQEYV